MNELNSQQYKSYSASGKFDPATGKIVEEFMILTSSQALCKAAVYLSNGLEPSFSDMPTIHSMELLPDTMPRYPQTKCSAMYYKDGGNQWPERWNIKCDAKGKANVLAFIKGVSLWAN